MTANSKQLDELLLWLRSERAKRENLQVDALPYSSQFADSSGFNRLDPKPIYEIKADKEIPKASSKSKRRYKLQKRISCEELDERTMKGLCVFCEEPETPDHYLQHMNSCLLMIDSEDHLSDSMVNKIGNEISSDRWLSNSIGCELEIGETANDEDRAPSDSDLVVNDIKKENPEDQALNDEELVETEVATELNGIEDRAVENEANTEVISAIVKEEQIPQIQVPISKLEHGLQIHNASPTVCEDSQYVVGCDELCENQGSILQISHVKERNVLVTESASVTINQVAHQLLDKMSFRVQSKRRQIKCHKSRRFKFKQKKQQRGKLRSAHQLIHRGNVMYKYLCSSAKVALMKKNKFSITWPTLKDDCFMEDDQVYRGTLPLWLLVRFKFWKFKFMNRKLQKMMREHGYSSYLKLKSDVGEDDEMFTGAKAVGMRFLLGIMLGITDSDASQGQQAVFEKIVMMNEWLQPSLVIEQVMRDKKIKFTKQWMFKFKMDSKPARINHILHQEKKSSKSPKSWMFKYKFDEADQGDFRSRTRWTQEVPDVICFFLRRHLHLHLDCKEPELAGRKMNHGVCIRLHSKQKQRKCSKCWMFKFRNKNIDQWLGGYNLIATYLENKKTWMFKYKAPNLDTKVLATSGQCIRKRLFVSADRGTKNNKSTMRFLMDTKQYHLSLRAIRVWDPGGSETD